MIVFSCLVLALGAWITARSFRGRVSASDVPFELRSPEERFQVYRRGAYRLIGVLTALVGLAMLLHDLMLRFLHP